MLIPEPILANLRRRGKAATIPAAAFEPRAVFAGNTIQVPDGDGLYLSLTAGSVHVRLFGVDAPEWGQAYAKGAWLLLSRLTLKKKITCSHIANDKYGRLVCEIFPDDGTLPALELLNAGLAWHSSMYAPHRDDYATAQAIARMYRRGIWSENNPMPPWRFRRIKKSCLSLTSSK